MFMSTTTPIRSSSETATGSLLVTRCTGTFSGEMTTPDGNVIAPTGKAFDLDFATTARWEGGLLAEDYVFWDSALQAQQIGLA
jgi:hypothetical protein